MTAVELVPVGACPGCHRTYEAGPWTVQRCQPAQFEMPPWCAVRGMFGPATPQVVFL